jgi:hypothetical protein
LIRATIASSTRSSARPDLRQHDQQDDEYHGGSFHSFTSTG